MGEIIVHKANKNIKRTKILAVSESLLLPLC